MASPGGDGGSADLAPQRCADGGPEQAANARPDLFCSCLWRGCCHLAARRRSEPSFPERHAGGGRQALVVTEAGTLRSIADALSELAQRLDTGYFDAAKVVDQQSDDIRFFHAEDGDPPWLMVAREEA